MQRYTTKDDAIATVIIPALGESADDFDVDEIFNRTFEHRVDTNDKGQEMLGTAGFEEIVSGEEFWTIVEECSRSSHIIATSNDHDGQGFIIPADWRKRLIAAGEDAADWTAFEAADLEHTDVTSGRECTFGFEVVEVEWAEDETFETFAAAVREAGFEVKAEDMRDDETPVRAL